MWTQTARTPVLPGASLLGWPPHTSGSLGFVTSKMGTMTEVVRMVCVEAGEAKDFLSGGCGCGEVERAS